MSENERNTHFQKYADLLFPDVSKLFFTLYARIEEHRPIEEIDAVEDEIRTLLAQQAYDLVEYTVRLLPHLMQVADDAQTTHDVIRYIPDMTTRPED